MESEAPVCVTPVEPAADITDPQVQRRNFLALMGDYVLFGIAFTFLNPSNLPPDFVARLGGSPVLVGLSGLIYRVLWLLPQLFFASYVNRAARKKHYATVPALPARGVFLPTGLLMALAGPGQPGLLIALLLSGYMVLAVGDGLSVVAWMDVVGSSLSSAQRGWLFGYSQAVTGVIVAVAVSPLVRIMLGPQGPAFPYNYALLMGVSGVLLLMGLFSYTRLKEGSSPPPQDSPSLRQYRTFLGRLLRQDRHFRHYLMTRFIYDLSTIGGPFYIVFATQHMGQESATALSDQILLTTLMSTVTSLVMARINQRHGSRRVILIAAVAALVSPLLILSTSLIGVLGLHLMWISVGVLNVAFVPGILNWVVEYAPEGYRPIYSGLANTLSAAALAILLLGGVIVETLGYQALFGVAAALGGTALLLALRLPEPRTLRRQAGPEDAVTLNPASL